MVARPRNQLLKHLAPSLLSLWVKTVASVMLAAFSYRISYSSDQINTGIQPSSKSKRDALVVLRFCRKPHAGGANVRLAHIPRRRV